MLKQPFKIRTHFDALYPEAEKVPACRLFLQTNKQLSLENKEMRESLFQQKAGWDSLYKISVISEKS